MSALIDSTARSDGVSLYVRLAASLRARINKGEWAVGERIPPFDELAATYGLAINTVRKAIDLLCLEGLVQSGRGRGTVVAARSAPLIDELLRSAMYDPRKESDQVVIDVLELVLAPFPIALVEDYTPIPPYTRILKTHSLHGTPFGLLDIYVVKHAFDRFPEGAVKKHKVLNLLRTHGQADIRRSRQQLTITYADDAIASTLKCRPAIPFVHIRRWCLDSANRIVMGCDILYRGDMFVWDVTESERCSRPIVPHDAKK